VKPVHFIAHLKNGLVSRPDFIVRYTRIEKVLVMDDLPSGQ
jgi:hypothetical protein